MDDTIAQLQLTIVEAQCSHEKLEAERADIIEEEQQIRSMVKLAADDANEALEHVIKLSYYLELAGIKEETMTLATETSNHLIAIAENLGQWRPKPNAEIEARKKCNGLEIKVVEDKLVSAKAALDPLKSYRQSVLDKEKGSKRKATSSNLRTPKVCYFRFHTPSQQTLTESRCSVRRRPTS